MNPDEDNKILVSETVFLDRENSEVISEANLGYVDAKWKVVIAQHIHSKTTANNPWIAERLNRGHPSRVSNLLNKR